MSKQSMIMKNYTPQRWWCIQANLKTFKDCIKYSYILRHLFVFCLHIMYGGWSKNVLA